MVYGAIIALERVLIFLLIILPLLLVLLSGTVGPVAAMIVPSKRTTSRPTHPARPMMTPNNKKVIVIGAGFSGLSVAYHLQKDQKGGRTTTTTTTTTQQAIEVELVEARDRIGGRVHTVDMNAQRSDKHKDKSAQQQQQLKPSCWIDLGGQWIHEANDRTNPLCQLIQKDLGLRLEPDYDHSHAPMRVVLGGVQRRKQQVRPRRRRRFNVVFDSATGREIPKSLMKDASRYFYKGMEDFEWKDVNRDTSFQELLSTKWNKLTQRKRGGRRQQRTTTKSYNHLAWTRLPRQVQKAAKTLGYTRALWDTDQEPASANQSWHQLSQKEQNAATVLGYNPQTWDDPDSSSSSSLSTTKPPLPYEDVDWNELPRHARAAASVLGYNQALWDEDGSSAELAPLENKYWQQLTLEEQKAAQTLGYTEATWDDVKGDGSSTSSSSSSSSSSTARLDVTREEEEHLQLACAWNYLQHQTEIYEGGRMEELSASLSEIYQNLGGPDKLPPVGGYGRVLGALMERLTTQQTTSPTKGSSSGSSSTTSIRLNSPVRSIRYNPMANTIMDSKSGGSGVQVCLVDGSILVADCCVCTVPLGVLKDQSIKFDPPLPESHRNAIASIGMGILNKIILQFESAFWGDLGQFGIADAKDPAMTKIFLDCSPPNHDQGDGAAESSTKILILFLGGNAARRIDPHDADKGSSIPLSDDEAVEDAMDSLRTVFGKKIPDPVATRVTRWGSDPFSRGGYSFAKVGCESNAYDDIARPLGDLLFAGEHTSKQSHSTVHGAWETGQREAKRISTRMISITSG